MTPKTDMKQQSRTQSKQLLRIREVTARTGLPKASLYKAIRAGRFPQSVRLGPNSVAWDADDIEGWINERIADSRKVAA